MKAPLLRIKEQLDILIGQIVAQEEDRRGAEALTKQLQCPPLVGLDDEMEGSEGTVEFVVTRNPRRFAARMADTAAR